MGKILTNEVKAEAGFAIPKLRATKYPWDTMKIGESFPFEKLTNPWGYCTGANKRYKPKKYRPGKTDDGETRIWRVE